MNPMTLKIDGMSCQHCVVAVAGALQAVRGIRVLAVAVGRVEVTVDEPGRLEEVTAAIENAGYRVVSTASRQPA